MAVATPPKEKLLLALITQLGTEGITAVELAELISAKVPEELTAGLAEALWPDTDPALADELWAQDTDVDARELTVAEEVAEAELMRVVDDSLSQEDAGVVLGITRQAVSKRIAVGSLVAVQRGNKHLVPRWQLHNGAGLPHLKEVIAAWPGSALALTLWVGQAQPDLDGAVPAVMLRRPNGATAVLDVLESLSARAW